VAAIGDPTRNEQRPAAAKSASDGGSIVTVRVTECDAKLLSDGLPLSEVVLLNVISSLIFQHPA
jgi:hypothetical protein